MATSLKDQLRRYYRAAKFQLSNPRLDFEEDTLPWIDRPGADIEAFVKQHPAPAGFPYDLAELLHHWREQGYVILKQALPVNMVENLWQEIEDVIEQHEEHSVEALVYQFNDQKLTPLKDVPKEKLHGIGARLAEYHSSSVGAKRVMAHPHLAAFMNAVFNEPVAVFQSLIFKYSSQQDAHQDFPWVRSQIPSHLAAAWIPLEDVHPDSGPLFYYPGSHRMPKFNFGTGILHKGDESIRTPEQFGKFLDKSAVNAGIPRKVLLLEKGDVLFWHGALAHGGSRIVNPALTRKSFVCHYSTVRSHPKHSYETGNASSFEQHNGVTIYANPRNLAEENKMTGGATW